MNDLMIIDYPLIAEGLSLFLDLRVARPMRVSLPVQIHSIPLHALILIERFLPENQCGLYLAVQLRESRPDLIPILWTTYPLSLHLWAAMEYKLPGFLDKAMPAPDLLYWLRQAMVHRTTWPGYLLDQAYQWHQEVGLRLKALTGDHWLLWLGLLRGLSNTALVTDLAWSRRSLDRRTADLFTILGVQSRSEAVGLAWQWGLVKESSGSLDWLPMVRELFHNPMLQIQDCPNKQPIRPASTHVSSPAILPGASVRRGDSFG